MDLWIFDFLYLILKLGNYMFGILIHSYTRKGYMDLKVIIKLTSDHLLKIKEENKLNSLRLNNNGNNTE